MNTCKDSRTTKTLVINASQAEDMSRYNYKVVGTVKIAPTSLYTREVIVHRCNSQAEAHRVYMAALTTGKYKSVYYTTNK